MAEQLRVEADQCTLEATLEVDSAGGATLAYTFQNGSAQNAYVFNLIYEDIGDDNMFLANPNAVYVQADGESVLLSKEVIPVPPTLLVEKPFIPCATLVEAGATTKEIIHLSLPLRPWHHYLMLEDEDFADEPVELPPSFELGFFLATPEADKLAKTVKTPVGEAKYFYPFSASSQKLLRVGPFTAKLPVRLPK